jgi:hypothetical protein
VWAHLCAYMHERMSCILNISRYVYHNTVHVCFPLTGFGGRGGVAYVPGMCRARIPICSCATDHGRTHQTSRIDRVLKLSWSCCSLAQGCRASARRGLLRLGGVGCLPCWAARPWACSTAPPSSWHRTPSRQSRAARRWCEPRRTSAACACSVGGCVGGGGRCVRACGEASGGGRLGCQGRYVCVCYGGYTMHRLALVWDARSPWGGRIQP